MKYAPIGSVITRLGLGLILKVHYQANGMSCEEVVGLVALSIIDQLIVTAFIISEIAMQFAVFAPYLAQFAELNKN